MTNGFPEIVIKHPLIEQIGEGSRIDESVSIWRRGDLDIALPLITIGDGVVLLKDVRLVVSNKNETQLAGIYLGNRVIVNVGSFLSGEGGLYIDDEVLIGPHVRILTAGHNIDLKNENILRNDLTYAPVRIRRGAGCTILQGRDIGEGAVVGAGSVVTRDVPSFAVVVGNPARIVRFRGKKSSLTSISLLTALMMNRLQSKINNIII